MEVHFGLDDIPALQHSVITVGSFDGVHKGHRKIIEALISKAKEYGTQSILITFHPHPRLVLNHFDQSLKMLNTLDEKTSLFRSLGVDHMVVIPFTPEFAAQSPKDYIEDFLIKYFKPKAIVLGYDHQFGKGRVGTKEIMNELKSVYQYEVFEVGQYDLLGETVSSTKIRNLIVENNFDKAKDYLGYQYPISGRVVMGDKMAGLMGYPTANIMINDASKLIPRHGVYAVKMKWKSFKKEGMMYIGHRSSTHAKSPLHIEVNLFDFHGELYGEQAWVEIYQFIRSDIHFESKEILLAQIKDDQEKILAYFKSL